MKLLCKPKIKSHTCLETSSLRTILTEEGIAYCSRAFWKPKNAEEEWKLTENCTYPKVNYYTEKVFFLKKFSGMTEW